MEFIRQYKYFVVPFGVWFAIQLFKVICDLVKTKKFNFKRIMGAGGMPSSHSAAASSIATAIGMVEGFNSPIFALALVFTCIVAYDSSGVRRESGNQAVMINKIVMGLKIHGDLKGEFMKLKEQLGHKPLEVLFGILLGILVGVLYTI